jgi:HK97 family phage portal protein
MNIFNLFKRKSQGITTSQGLSDHIGFSLDTYAGRRVSPALAMQLTAVFGCVRVLTESVGMLPCFLYQATDNGRKKAPKEKLYSLLYVAPNNYMTPQEFWEYLIGCLCLRGNFYAYKVKVFGEVVELLPLLPGSVQPKLNEKWEPVYQVTFPDGSCDVLSQDEIWHVRTFSMDSLVGLSPISYARQAIGLGLATEEHGSRLFSNGAVSSSILQTDQVLTDEAYKRLKDNFQEHHQGLSNAHKPMILEMGLKWNNISMSAEDAQFLETRKFQLEEICRIFRVPMHLVQNTDRATFNNIENLGMGFVNYSLVPYLTRIEQRINIGLVNKEKRGQFYAKFNVGALLRGDMKSRYESYATGINWGILSPNECRDLEERNPRDGGDIYLTPMNMTAKPQDNNKDAKQKET